MELTQRILDTLNTADNTAVLDSYRMAEDWSEDHQRIVGAVKSLQCLDQVIQADIHTVKRWELTDEGKKMAAVGSHEAIVYNAVPSSGIEQKELMKAVGDVVGKFGFSKAMSNGWLMMDNSAGKPLVKRKVAAIEDTVQKHLVGISKGDSSAVPDKSKVDYKKRSLLHEVSLKCYKIGKGPNFTTRLEKAETELTPEMIGSGSWKDTKFKPYNFQTLGLSLNPGNLHPLLKVRAEFRQIFLEMGFSEMPTNNYVESSFWNFDALFQPQQHPARDAHDTFFVSDPADAAQFPVDYLERVKNVHSNGGYGSQGYGYDWKIGEAKKNLLRTHTTAVSARMLYQLAQSCKTDKFKAHKFFSIDRVFRNETLDATHLAEFHQIEGVVADYGLTLGDLIGTLYEFFKKLGIEKLRFKPAYNPYTEPSMEVFSYHEGLGKWVEIGNSGLFRPEMLLPMGLPEGVNVIAWGLSLERPTMIKYGINNIRDLCGNKVNLKMVQENPICRLDKNSHGAVEALASATEQRWIRITERLDSLHCKLNALRASSNLMPSRVSYSSNFERLVIKANPKRPPYAVRALLLLLSEQKPVAAQTHVHSSLSVAQIPSGLNDFISANEGAPRKADGHVGVTFIWTNTCSDVTLSAGAIIAHNKHIVGEADIVRYLSRLLGAASAPLMPYDSDTSPLESARIDNQLDSIVHMFVSSSPDKERLSSLSKLTPVEGAGPWLCGPAISIADFVLWSFLKKHGLRGDNDLGLKKWHQNFINSEVKKYVA